MNTAYPNEGCLTRIDERFRDFISGVLVIRTDKANKAVPLVLSRINSGPTIGNCYRNISPSRSFNDGGADLCRLRRYNKSFHPGCNQILNVLQLLRLLVLAINDVHFNIQLLSNLIDKCDIALPKRVSQHRNRHTNGLLLSALSFLSLCCSEGAKCANAQHNKDKCLDGFFYSNFHIR